MFIPPMLLQKREQPFDDPRYLFEPKIDGHRLVLTKVNGEVRLFTRHNTEVTNQYPELHNVPVGSANVILDGEVACVDARTGAVDFEAVMGRFKAKSPMQAAARSPVHFYVFDVLQINGEDVRSRPLIERKALLNEIMVDSPYFSHILSVDGVGTALYDVIKSRSMEGIVAKRKDSRYISRRSPEWLKIINYTYAEVQIAGYRRDDFGWMVQHEGKYAGVIELAVPVTCRKAFYNMARTITIGEDKNYVYVQPFIKVRVRTRNWTKAGLLRSPEFVDFVI